MKDLKEKLAPVLGMIDALDSEAVLAITGVLFILGFIIGGLEDVVAMVVGIWIGFAIFKKFLK
ncbi:MAG: hypothetical protein VXW87_00995 [Pseudomonadota bacterium]|nr:hypothetical protein [Pseudomonadota bacterium]